MTHRHRRAMSIAIAGLVCIASAGQAVGLTPTPTATASPTPQRTGDLGTKVVAGHVYDASFGPGAGIAGATVRSGAGPVTTDAQGDFVVTLFLRDTDTVVFSASAEGFAPGDAHFTGAQLWFLQGPVEIGLVPLDNGYTVSGIVHGDVNCPPDSLITVELAKEDGSDLPRAAETTAEVEFFFPHVADGDYIVSATAACQPSYYPPVAVYVRGGHAYTELDPDPCPPNLVLEPARGLPGVTVDVIGRCYYIHSGGGAQLWLDGVLAAATTAGTVGDYHAQVAIPADAADGWHVVIATNRSGEQIGAGGYFVDSSSTRACIGDCDRDGTVTIDELLQVVNLGLGLAVPFGCPAATAGGTGPVQISDIIAAVNAALAGCRGPERGTCYEDTACMPYELGPHTQFSTSRGECCRLWRGRSLPFSWCPADAYDASSGTCSACASPC